MVKKSRKGINNTRCCVPGCHGKKTPSVSFHTFPTKKNWVRLRNKFGLDEKVERSKAWLIKLKIGRRLFRRAVVCSLHFTREDYILPDCPTKRRRLKSTAVPSQNLPKSSHETHAFKKRSPLQHDFTFVETKASVEGVSKTFNVEEECSSDTGKSRKRSRQGTVPSRKTKTSSKISTNDQNGATEDDDDIFIEPKVKEFENDNKFEVFYLDPVQENVGTRKPSESVDGSDEASESSNGFDFFQESLDSQHLCRICLSASSLTHLTKCQSLVGLFVSITNIEMELGDNLPKYMCVDCIRKLEDISMFICIAKKNDQKLKRKKLINKEMRNDSLHIKDEESSEVAEDISNVSGGISNNDFADVQSLNPEPFVDLDNKKKTLSSDVTNPNSTDLRKYEPKKALLKKDKKEQNNIENEDYNKKSFENQTPEQNDHYSAIKNDCICWKCGEVYVGLQIPKIIQDLPSHQLKFHCLNCSKPNGNPTIHDTNLTSLQRKVYPGRTSNGKIKKIRCITCSESFALSEFVTHQLQKHSVKKEYKCNLCFSSFSHPSLLRQHAGRHT